MVTLPPVSCLLAVCYDWNCSISFWNVLQLPSRQAYMFSSVEKCHYCHGISLSRSKATRSDKNFSPSWVLAKVCGLHIDLSLPHLITLSASQFPAPIDFTLKHWTQKHELSKPFWRAGMLYFLNYSTMWVSL